MVYVSFGPTTWVVSKDRRCWVPLRQCADAITAMESAHVAFPNDLVVIVGDRDANPRDLAS